MQEGSEEHPPNHAEAPLFATFAAHFAEASSRFWPYESNPPGMLKKYKMIIPITDGSDAWYGDRDG